MKKDIYQLLKTSGLARYGQLTLRGQTIETPTFMPCGTRATVKGLSNEEIKQTQTKIILGNTFHLMLRPGDELVRELGGLHEFMGWSGPILTDSGGFQVFSLGDLRKLNEHGVVFRSPVNGDKVELTPESSINVQANLGSDVVMVLDECTEHPATFKEADESMQLSLRPKH